MARKVVFYIRQEQWYIVGFRYNADLVHALKADIPGRERKWNAKTKSWSIAITYWDVFCRLMDIYEYDIEDARE